MAVKKVGRVDYFDRSGLFSGIRQLTVMHEIRAERQSPVVVHVEELDGGPPSCSEANYLRAAQCKMFLPNIAAGVKQIYNGVRVRIDGGQIGAFLGIAPVTCQAQVTGIIGAVVLFREDVFDVKWVEWNQALRDTTVLATITCAANYRLANVPIHQADPCLRR